MTDQKSPPLPPDDPESPPPPPLAAEIIRRMTAMTMNAMIAKIMIVPMPIELPLLRGVVATVGGTELVLPGDDSLPGVGVVERVPPDCDAWVWCCRTVESTK